MNEIFAIWIILQDYLGKNGKFYTVIMDIEKAYD